MNKKIVKRVKRKPMVRTVGVRYKCKEGYAPIYANGVYGGVSCCGEIIMHFFTESTEVPIESSIQIVNNKSIGEIVTKPQDIAMVHNKYIETGIIINLQTAKNIKDWLENHITNLERLQNDEV